MEEIGSELGPALKMFLLSLFRVWWSSLDQKSKGHIVFGFKVAAVMATIVFVVLVLRAIVLRILLPLVEHMKAYASKIPPGEEFVNTSVDQIYLHLYLPWQLISQELNPSVFLALILLLTAACGDWSHNFYVMLRFVVSGTFLWLAVLMHRRGNSVWKTTLVLLAVLFNPLAPFRLQRDTWQAWNLIAAASLMPAAVAYMLKHKARLQEVKTTPLKDASRVPEAQPMTVPAPRKYRYCKQCSRRVAIADTHCRRCNSVLDSMMST